jgi:hypothetical protein
MTPMISTASSSHVMDSHVAERYPQIGYPLLIH